MEKTSKYEWKESLTFILDNVKCIVANPIFFTNYVQINMLMSQGCRLKRQMVRKQKDWASMLSKTGSIWLSKLTGKDFKR